MTSLTDRTIAVLRLNHLELAALVTRLSPEQLTQPSAASEWSIAQVLSHLGSGAEIALAGLRSALAGDDAPGQEFNQTVWNRWNAMGPDDHALGFLIHNEMLVHAFDALTGHQRETTQVKLGFLPMPLSIGGIAGMRLNEAAQHSWDVRAAVDPAATLDPGEADVLIQLMSGELSMMVGFMGNADHLSEPAVVDVHGYGLSIADRVTLSAGVEGGTATFNGPLEAAIRLLGGRLKPQDTSADITVTGNISLEDLRAVFPGY